MISSLKILPTNATIDSSSSPLSYISAENNYWKKKKDLQQFSRNQNLIRNRESQSDQIAIEVLS